MDIKFLKLGLVALLALLCVNYTQTLFETPIYRGDLGMSYPEKGRVHVFALEGRNWPSNTTFEVNLRMYVGQTPNPESLIVQENLNGTVENPIKWEAIRQYANGTYCVVAKVPKGKSITYILKL